MSERVVITPEDAARFEFDAKHNVRPAREIAERIAQPRLYDSRDALVGRISHAIEDAWEIGEKRAALKYGK